MACSIQGLLKDFLKIEVGKGGFLCFMFLILMYRVMERPYDNLVFQECVASNVEYDYLSP